MLCKLTIFAQPTIKDMATVTPFIRTSTKAKDVNVRFRLTDGRNVQLFHTSDIIVYSEYWDSKKYEIKAKVSEITMKSNAKKEFNKRVSDRKELLLNAYAKVNEATSEAFDLEIDKILNPDKYIIVEANKSFFQVFDDFVKAQDVSVGRICHFKVLRRILQRYELYMQQSKKDFTLDLETVTSNTLNSINDFILKEHLISKKYPKIYTAIEKSRIPQERGQNTITSYFVKLRTFFFWCSKFSITSNNPFKLFEIKPAIYGTPYYITIDERNMLHRYDFSSRPQLAIQRDIFVFQCVIGCRVGDLLAMTKANIVDGAIDYIPKKTKEGDPLTVSVPLNSIAKEILAKYPDGKKLLPFISSQNYNTAIKEIFTFANLNRIVTVLNSTTRKEEKRPLNEIASSHLARRTFIGNLYNKIQDPNAIGALSGHTDGSRSFARYKNVPKEMKVNMVNMLE